MKKLLLFLLISITGFAQQTNFPYGIKNTGASVEVSPTMITTHGATNVYGKVSVNNLPVSIAVQDSLDKKLNISDLPSNLTLYPTTTASDVDGYVVMVTDIHDVRYDDTAVNVSTPSITTTDQLVSSRIADAGTLVGQPGVFNATSFGNIRRLSGSGTATFYFRVYHRTEAGIETLIGQSSNSAIVSSSSYLEFTASLIWDDGTFSATDRIVVKTYANRIAGGSDPVYQFQFGGATPVRLLLPVPFSVVDAGYEMKSNKQNSLAVDGTGTKYPTVDAVNSLIVSVKSFGAVGNGVTNDSAAFQAANNYLATNGGGTLNVPRGTYITNFIIDSKVYLKGEGVNATILKSANSSNLDVIQGRSFLTLTGTAKQNPENRGIRYFGISNLLIDGNKVNNTLGYGIRFWGCSTIWDNVIVQNCANDGIWSEFTSHDDPTSYTDKSTQALESSFRNIKSLGNGSNGWTYSGPHDGAIENFIAFSNVGYALYQTTGYSGVSGRNWNSWLNGNSFYFGAGANVDYLIASGGYSGVGVEFGAGSGGANLTNFTSGGHITGIILRGSNHRIEGDISNCRNSGFTAGDGIILDGTIGCAIDITGVGNFNVIKKNTGGENGKNNITAIVNVATGGSMVSGLDLSTSDYLNLRSSGIVAYEKFQIGTNTVNFSLPTANFLALSNGSGNSNGIDIKSSGWPYSNRVGSTSGNGNEFILSQNYNFATSLRDNAAYSTSYFKMNVVTGLLSFGNGNTPTDKFTINVSGFLGIPTTPTTSAGTYDILTRNTSTGVVEKVLSNTIATVASPAFTGTPTAPTATVGTNTTQIATTAFVQTATRPYKVYTALLTQSGTSAPTAIILENTLSGSIVWSYSAAGVYYGTLTGAFLSNKAIAFVTGIGFNKFIGCQRLNDNVMQITSVDTTNAPADTTLISTSIEIRVYN